MEYKITSADDINKISVVPSTEIGSIIARIQKNYNKLEKAYYVHKREKDPERKSKLFDEFHDMFKNIITDNETITPQLKGVQYITQADKIYNSKSQPGGDPFFAYMRFIGEIIKSGSGTPTTSEKQGLDKFGEQIIKEIMEEKT